METSWETKCLPVDESSIKYAAELLRAGQPVAIPTETVYGLACDALNAEAVQRVFEAKGRPRDNPMIVHIDGPGMLPLVAKKWPESAQRLADAFWPGPLTLVLPKAEKIPDAASAGLPTVGIRLPAHPGARAVIKAAGLPLAAPSANRSGRPSPTMVAHVMQDMAGRIPLVLDGGSCPVGVESTVLALAGVPTVLRPGFVTAQEIAEVLGCEVAFAQGGHVLEETPLSPGMKYRHYAPRTELTLVDSGFEKFREYLGENAKEIPGLFALCHEGEEARLPVPAVSCGRQGDAASQGARLYAALRELDARGAKVAYARLPVQDGLGQAVYNRLLRAASFHVIKL